jgi:hypothetical protein
MLDSVNHWASVGPVDAANLDVRGGGVLADP